MSSNQNPHLDPIIVAPLHYPKIARPLGSLLTEKDKADVEKELFGATKVKVPANAHLSYRGGPLISNVQIYTIFWGKKWATDPTLTGLVSSINSFFSAILVSPLIDQLSEYNVPGHTIGHGSLIGTKNITSKYQPLQLPMPVFVQTYKAGFRHK